MSYLARSLILGFLLVAATACGGGGSDVAGAREDFANEPQTIVGMLDVPVSGGVIFGGGGEPSQFEKPGEASTALRTGQFVFRQASMNRDGIPGTIDITSEFRIDNGDFTLSSTDAAANGEGGIGPQNELALIANRTVGKPPQLFAFVRSQSQSEVSEFAGLYHRMSLSRSINNGNLLARYHRATLDGGTTASFETGLQNSEGSVTPHVDPSVDYEFSVKSIILDRPGMRLIGRSTSNGDVILFAALGQQTQAAMQVWIRRATNATLESVRGTYRLATLQDEGGHHSSGVGTVELDGEGGGTYRAALTDGIQGGIVAEDIAYAVAPDGTLDIFRANGMQMRGGISADGRVAALIHVSALSPASLTLLLRE